MIYTVRDDGHGKRHTMTTDGVDDSPGGGSVRYCYGRRRISSFVKFVWQILSRAYAWGGWPYTEPLYDGMEIIINGEGKVVELYMISLPAFGNTKRL